jgi:hypothetical protein
MRRSTADSTTGRRRARSWPTQRWAPGRHCGQRAQALDLLAVQPGRAIGQLGEASWLREGVKHLAGELERMAEALGDSGTYPRRLARRPAGRDDRPGGRLVGE